jgi:hypothetical protein
MILMFDAFEKANITNISPTSKVDISIKLGITKDIILGATCSLEEVLAHNFFFQKFRNIFALSYIEMLGLEVAIVECCIGTWPNVVPINQNKRLLHPSKEMEIKGKINKIHKVGFIYPIMYTSRVSNPVLVNKKQGTIHVCTKFRDLIQACLQDKFSTPFTNQVIDACSRTEVLSLLDIFFRYNKIESHHEN